MIHNLKRFGDDDDADINRHWFVEEAKEFVSAVDSFSGHSHSKCFQYLDSSLEE